MQSAHPAWAAVDLEALAANYAEAQRLAAGAEVIAVVKANGYGHGAAAVARRLCAAGCGRLAVANLVEAAELRAAGIAARILVFGGAANSAAADRALELGAAPVIHRPEQVALLGQRARRAGRRLPVQLEVDTGMRRMGVAPESAAALAAEIAGAEGLELEGVWTHLACADSPDLAPARAQLSRFGEVLAALRARGVSPGLVHMANSAALLAAPQLAPALPPGVNAVRPGLLLYGVLPAPHLRGRAALRPVMSLHARIAQLRRVVPGDTVGYGAAFRARREGRIATLPVGYADGIPWSLGNRGHALLRGRRVPIAGRISMDATTLDIGCAPADLGDPVALFGAAAGEESALLPVEEVAEAAGTIPYELLVRVGRRIPLIFRGAVR